MSWNVQQQRALKEVDAWFNSWHTNRNKRNAKQIYRIFGYAGTGKTTLAKHFAENVDGDVLFAAFTGKASLVLRKNGCEGARTIHSLIYKANVNEETGDITWLKNKESPLSDAKLLIVDECSMVDNDLGNDLISFGVPILVLGDPEQLPPVSGAGYFTNGNPDIMLTEIHRQAKDNPIIYIATEIRNGVYPDYGSYGESRIIPKMSSTDALEADQLLVGRNVTREDMNKKVRKLLKLNPDHPVVGDKLICLKNDKDLGIFNGGMFTLKQILDKNKKYSTNFFYYSLESDDEERPPIITKIHKSFFVDEVPVPDWKVLKGSQQMDYAYAITTHRSQGSQWKNVTIVDESYCFREHRFKWLYTAVTRAKEKITLVKG